MKDILEALSAAAPNVERKMLILQDGRMTGTIGGGCLEAKVITEARELMIQPEKKRHIDQSGSDYRRG